MNTDASENQAAGPLPIPTIPLERVRRLHVPYYDDFIQAVTVVSKSAPGERTNRGLCLPELDSGDPVHAWDAAKGVFDGIRDEFVKKNLGEARTEATLNHWFRAWTQDGSRRNNGAWQSPPPPAVGIEEPTVHDLRSPFWPILEDQALRIALVAPLVKDAMILQRAISNSYPEDFRNVGEEDVEFRWDCQTALFGGTDEGSTSTRPLLSNELSKLVDVLDTWRTIDRKNDPRIPDFEKFLTGLGFETIEDVRARVHEEELARLRQAAAVIRERKLGRLYADCRHEEDFARSVFPGLLENGNVIETLAEEFEMVTGLDPEFNPPRPQVVFHAVPAASSVPATSEMKSATVPVGNKKRSVCRHRQMKPHESEAFYNLYAHAVVYVALKDKLEFCPSGVPAMDVRREAVYDFLATQNGPFGTEWARKFGIDAALGIWNTILAARPRLRSGKDRESGLKEFEKLVHTAIAKYNRDHKTNKGSKSAHQRRLKELARLFNECCNQ